MRFIPILFVLSCSLCLAQQGSDKERAARMFFPPETKDRPTRPSKRAARAAKIALPKPSICFSSD